MYLLSAINSDKSFICEHYNIDTRKNPVKYIKKPNILRKYLGTVHKTIRNETNDTVNPIIF